MKRKHLHITLNTVIAITMTVFFSCKNNFKDVQQVGVLQNEPIGEADTINLKYTDSFRLKANLLSPRMYNYSNRKFPFLEFPKGIELIIYDNDGQKSKIFADYAIIYSDTDLIDLRGNVILATHKKDSLFTEQMYYDEKNEWVFTNFDFRWRSEGNDIYGTGFDADRNFEEPEILGMNNSIMELDN